MIAGHLGYTIGFRRAVVVGDCVEHVCGSVPISRLGVWLQESGSGNGIKDEIRKEMTQPEIEIRTVVITSRPRKMSSMGNSTTGFVCVSVA